MSVILLIASGVTGFAAFIIYLVKKTKTIIRELPEDFDDDNDLVPKEVAEELINA